MKEIERKFIFNKKFNLDLTNKVNIKQIYLSKAPKEVRVRRYKDLQDNFNYEKTTKIGIGLVRDEYNKVISLEEFSMIERSYNIFIEKDRVTLNSNNKEFYIDIYKDGLKTVEIEFDSVEEALAFNPLEFNDLLCEEITGNVDYSNYNLALKK